MNIAVILPSLAHKGPIVLARDVIHGIQGLTNKLTFTVFYFDPISEVAINTDCFQVTMQEDINFADYDLIHTHGLRPDLYVFLNKRKINAPYVSTMHNYMQQDLKYRYNKLVSIVFSWFWRWILKSHDKLIVLSEHMKAYYAKYYPTEDLAVIHSGRNIHINGDSVVDEDFKHVKELKNRCILLGINAQVTYLKGVDQVIKFLAKYDSQKKYALVVVGSGEAVDELRKMAKEYSVHDRVVFLGYKKNVIDYLRLYDIYMMPSRTEGFGLALLEAAAAEKAIVCSDIAIFKELFTTDEVSFFRLDDIQSLSQAIERALGQKDKLGHAAYKKYAKNYTAEIMAKNYLTLYNALIKQH